MLCAPKVKRWIAARESLALAMSSGLVASAAVIAVPSTGEGWRQTA
jgi:hypothetical protein